MFLNNQNPSILISTLNFLPVFNVKAILWKFFIESIFRLKLPFLFFESSTKEYLYEKYYFQELEDAFHKIFNQSLGNFCVTFPRNFIRKKYYLFSELENEYIYIKASYGPKEQIEVKNEIKIISNLQDNFKNFHVPKLISFVNNKHIYASIYASLPGNVKTIKNWSSDIRKIWEELKSLNSQTLNLNQIPWLQNTPFLESILNLFKRYKKDTVTLSFAHGDFTPWNILVKDKNYYLIDFEESTHFAPKLLDPVHFIISKAIFLNHRSSDFIIAELLDFNQEYYSDDTHACELLLALVHEWNNFDEPIRSISEDLINIILKSEAL